MNKRLERPLDQAQIGGVCAGLAEYFGLDRTLIRVIFVAGIFLPSFPALLIYVILWIAMPERRFGTAAEPKLFSTPTFSMNPANPNNSSQTGSVVWGILLIVLGVLFLLDRWFDIDFRDLWPLMLIAIGVWLVLRDRMRGDEPPFGPNRPSDTSYGNTPGSTTYRETPTYGSSSTPTNPSSGYGSSAPSDPANPSNPNPL